MRKLNTSLLAGLAVTSLIYAGSVGADDERHRVKATLSGFQETPSTLSTPGSGRFTAKIDDDAQAIAPGEFAEVVRAIRNGAVYANVHSTLRPGGEIRGQLRADEEDD